MSQEVVLMLLVVSLAGYKLQQGVSVTVGQPAGSRSGVLSALSGGLVSERNAQKARWMRSLAGDHSVTCLCSQVRGVLWVKLVLGEAGGIFVTVTWRQTQLVSPPVLYQQIPHAFSQAPLAFFHRQLHTVLIPFLPGSS